MIYLEISRCSVRRKLRPLLASPRPQSDQKRNSQTLTLVCQHILAANDTYTHVKDNSMQMIYVVDDIFGD